MFSSEKAINSWFHILSKDNDFNYISNHVRRIVYEILSEILKIDDQFAKTKIMLWTYNIDKNDELLDRFDLMVQHFTDLVIHNDNQFSLIHNVYRQNSGPPSPTQEAQNIFLNFFFAKNWGSPGHHKKPKVK